MAHKRIGNLADTGIETIAIWGGIAFAAYYVVTNVLPNLFGGGADSVLSAEIAVGAQNPFSYLFQPFVDFYNQNPPGSLSYSATSMMPGWLQTLLGAGGAYTPNTPTDTPTIQQFFVALKQGNLTQSPWSLLDAVALSQQAEAIYNSIQAGILQHLNPLSTTDQTGAMSALANFQNQLQVAFVANYLWWNYNLDLLTFLHGTATSYGLNQANLDQLIQTVNALPVNPSV